MEAKSKKVFVMEPLHPYSCCGSAEDITRMRQILQTSPGSLDHFQWHTQGWHGRAQMSPLHVACDMVHTDCVKFLLEAGAAVNQDCPDGRSAVHYTVLNRTDPVASKDCHEIVKLLLEARKKGQKIYNRENSLYFDVIIMLQGNFNDIVKLMLEYGEVSANVKEMDSEMLERNSPFIAAVEANNIDGMKMLIMHGTKIANFMRYGPEKYAISCYIVQFYQSSDDAIKALKIFQYFGGNLWTKQSWFRFTEDRFHYIQDKTALDVVQELSPLVPSVSGISEQLENMTRNPLGLRELSRLALWRALGSAYWRSIDKLELPHELIDFLRLTDI